MRIDARRIRSALAALAALASTSCVPAGSAPGLQVLEDPLLPWSAAGYLARFELRPPEHGDVAGYQLERRLLPDGPFVPVPFYPASGPPLNGQPAPRLWMLFPAQLWHQLEPEAVDGASYEFRLRALPDPSGTRASAPVVVTLEPKYPVVVAEVVGGVPRLTLANRSARATSLEIVRRRGACDAWEDARSTFTVGAGTTDWPDPAPADLLDGGELSYDVSAVAGTLRSRAPHAYLRGTRTPPAVSAAATTAGVGVRIEARSRCPVAAKVFQARTSRPATAKVQVGAVDLWPSPTPPVVVMAPAAAAGATTYWIEAADISARGAPAHPGAWLLSPADPAALGAAAVGEPDATGALWLPSGGLAWVDRGALAVDTPLGPAARPVDWIRRGGTLSQVVTDGSGWPHVLLVTWDYGAMTETLGHFWFDGLAWRDEPVASRSGSIESPLLALGLDGSLVASWLEGADYRIGRRTGDGWAIQAAPARFTVLYSVSADAQGALHLLTTDWAPNGLRHWSDAGGGWTAEDLPSSVGAGILQTHSGGLLLVHRTSDGTPAMMTRDASGWSPPLPLPGGSPGGGRQTPIVRSQDGARLAWADEESATLWVMDAAGVTPWHWHDGRDLAGLGFGPDGKARLLTKTSDAPAIRFEEP